MRVWLRWAVVVTTGLALSGGCWFALTKTLPKWDIGVDVGVASIPLVIVLAVLAGWAERAREKNTAITNESPDAQRPPQDNKIVQVESGINLGSGSTFKLETGPSGTTSIRSDRPVGNRKIDHSSTYIEMHGGTLSIPSSPVTPESPTSGKNELKDPEIKAGLREASPESSKESSYLKLRATRVTSYGESQKIEIFDAELADQWIKNDPWNSTDLTGGSDGK